GAGNVCAAAGPALRTVPGKLVKSSVLALPGAWHHGMLCPSCLRLFSRGLGGLMDVRCDRCQTEYELDDASVTERGASVQCTTCGHTFTVSRPRAEFTPTPSPTTEAAPAWVLTTEEGKVHRFRDPTTLQKWIVERRVGRNDRVTAPGASARRLGDMDELRAFFDLVDQAGRASQSRMPRATQPETPQGLSAGRGYASPDVHDDDMLMGSRRSRGVQRDRVSRLDSDIAAGLTTMS